MSKKKNKKTKSKKLEAITVPKFLWDSLSEDAEKYRRLVRPDYIARPSNKEETK